MPNPDRRRPSPRRKPNPRARPTPSPAEPAPIELPRPPTRPVVVADEDALAALAELGYAEYLADRFDRSRVIFEGLCSLAPRNAYFLRALGEACLAEGDASSALRASNGAVALEPRSGAAYSLRGRALLAAGRPEDARSDLVRASGLGDALAADLVATL